MPDLKNIVIICEFAQFSGGSQNIAIGSALELANRGFNVYFFTAIGDECDELKHSRVHVKHLHITNITEDNNRISAALRGLYNNSAAKELQDLLNTLDKNQTIIHVHNWSNAFSSAVVKKATDMGFKTVITLHDYLIVCPNGGFYNYKQNHICNYEPMSLKCVLCNCDRRSFPQKIYRVVRELIQNKNIRYNSKLYFITISKLNDDLTRPRIRSKNFFRVENFVQTNRIVNSDRMQSNDFIFVGRLVQEKGVGIFCEAIRNLKRKFPTINALILGTGPLLDSLKEQYPEIEFTGWVNHETVDAVMAKARCLVFPSVLYECSPLTVIEALTNSLPCIVSDCTTATELIKDGLNGYTFKAGDAKSLEEKMEKALDSKVYRKVIENIGNSFDPSIYTISSYTDRIIDVYRQIEEDSE